MEEAEKLSVVGSSGEEMAWSRGYAVARLEDTILVAAPRLYLTVDTTLELAAARPYQEVFSGATLYWDGERHPFTVLHARFELYRSGEPEIREFAAVCSSGFDVSRLGALIKRSAELLRNAQGQGDSHDREHRRVRSRET